ncbi:hypothetical protein Tco_1269451, partial [Tanacetum coccineum]
PPKSLSSSATFPSRRVITPISHELSIYADTSFVVNEKQKEEGGVIDDPLAQPATHTSSRRSVCKIVSIFSKTNKKREVQEDQTNSATQLTSDDNSLTVSQVNDFDGGQKEQVCKSDQVKFGSSTVGSLEQDTRLVKATDPGMMTLRAPPKKASLSYGSKIQEAFVSSQQR